MQRIGETILMVKGRLVNDLDKRCANKRQFAHPTLAILIGLLTIGLVSMYIAADSPGYCSTQQRYVPDKEFTQTSLALLSYVRSQDKLLWDTSPKSYENYIKSYEVLQQNRKRDGFIEIDRSDTYAIFSRLLGRQQVQVVLNANSGDGQIKFGYDVCGTLLYSDTGLRNTHYQTITTTDYPKITN